MYVMFACDVCTLTVKRHYTADLRPRNTESCVIYLFSPVQGRNIWRPRWDCVQRGLASTRDRCPQPSRSPFKQPRNQEQQVVNRLRVGPRSSESGVYAI